MYYRCGVGPRCYSITGLLLDPPGSCQPSQPLAQSNQRLLMWGEEVPRTERGAEVSTHGFQRLRPPPARSPGGGLFPLQRADFLLSWLADSTPLHAAGALLMILLTHTLVYSSSVCSIPAKLQSLAQGRQGFKWGKFRSKWSWILIQNL